MALVTIKHIRQANYCTKGAREWFVRHEFSWSDFLQNGKDADDFDATGDALALKLSSLARQDT